MNTPQSVGALISTEEAPQLNGLHESGLLETPSEAIFDEVVRRASQVCGVPVAAITLINAQRHQWFKSSLGLNMTEASRALSFCDHTILQANLVVVPDAQSDPHFADAPSIKGEPSIRFYAGTPLVTEVGHILGTLCVFDKVPRSVTGEQGEALITLAHELVGQMEMAGQYEEAVGNMDERQQAQEAVQDSNATFHAIINASPVAYALNDEHQNITFLNAAFVRTFGYTLDDIATLADWWPRAYPDSRYRKWVVTTWRERLAEAKQDGMPFEAMELTIRCKDGTERIVLAGAAPLGASYAGTHLVSLYDITERKRAEENQQRIEEALRETLTLQQAILDSANYSIISISEDGMITSFNAGAERMLGYHAREVVGKATVTLLHDPIEFSERACLLSKNQGTLLKTKHEVLVAAARRGEAAETEWTYVREDGTRFPVTLSVMPLRDGRGEITGFLAIGRDITERKQAEAARQIAEENYQALFMNAAGGIFQTSPQGRYLQVNPALARIYGYETPQQMISELTDVAQQLYVEAGRRAEFERLMRQEGGVSRFESQVRRRDGSMIWISENARPIWDGSGELLRYEGFVEDISHQKALEAQQADALRDAIERADRDPLTGLLNHRAFFKRLEEETARAEREGTTLAVVMLDLDNFGFFNNVYGHIVGDRVLHQVADRLQKVCRPYDTLARFGGDEFAVLLPRVGLTSVSELEARLRSDLSGLVFRPEGEESAVPITVSVGSALFSDFSTDRQEVVRQADERLMRSKTGGVVEAEADQVRRSAQGTVAGFSMLDALVTAVDNKDRYTRRHSDDVMQYSLLIARELGLGEEQQRTVAVAALLHDVGKIGIPDAILRKPGKLTDEEFEAVKQHPQMGSVIVAAVPGLEDTLDAVRHHHERWDGGGYPFGLGGEETPLIARLMAVADAFSAMTTDRPYRSSKDREAALAILEAGAGAQWDPQCVEAFLTAMKKAVSGRSLAKTDGSIP